MKIVTIATNFVLNRHAQRSEVVNLGLKCFNARDSFIKLFLDGFNISLSHFKLMLHILFVNFELFLQTVGIDNLVANPESFPFEHLDLFSQADPLLFFTFKLFLKRLIHNRH